MTTRLYLKIRFIIFFIIVIILTPSLILLTCIFAIYRQIIYLILINKHGSKFGGLLSGKDALYGMETYRKASHVKNAIYDVILRKFNKNSKIFAHLQNYLGYYYYIRNEVTIDECIEKLTTPRNCNKDDFLRIAGEYFNKPLPHNHQALWEVSIGMQPIKWNEQTENDDILYYPLLLKFHHALSDGFFFIMFLINNFNGLNNMAMKSTKNCCIEKENLDGTHLTKPKLSGKLKQQECALTIGLVFKVWYTIKFCFLQLYYTYSVSAKLLLNLFMLEKTNPLHGQTLSFQKHYVTRFIESENYFKRIKIIKNNIPGCNFIDICLTAFSLSLGEYFKQKFKCLPKFITITLPELPESTQVERIAAVLNSKKVICDNSMAFTVFRLPVLTTHKATDTNLIKRVQEVHKNIHFFRNPAEIKINRMLLNTFLSFFPHPVTNFMLKMMGITAIVSNITGPPTFTMIGDYVVEDIITFPINRERTGVSLTLFSFNNKLQLTFVVDKILIPSEKVAYSILDGIYKYLDLLYDECIVESNET